jgi:hypothetical protein
MKENKKNKEKDDLFHEVRKKENAYFVRRRRNVRNKENADFVRWETKRMLIL